MQSGYLYPARPLPGRKDLRQLLPREFGCLVATYYRPDAVALEKKSTKRYGYILRHIGIQYKDDKVWVFLVWPKKVGPLKSRGTVTSAQGGERMQWEVTLPYAKFKRKWPYLRRMCRLVARVKEER